MANQDNVQGEFSAKVANVLKNPKLRVWAKKLGLLIVAFGLFGFFVAPPLAKYVMLKQLSAELQREVSVEAIDINPYALSAKISGVSVKAEGGKEVFGFDELFVNLSSASIFQLGIVVDEIRLQGPRIAVARVAEGRYDISDLLDKWMAPKEPSPTPRFSLNNIQLLNGKVEFDDRPKGKTHAVTDINLNVPFISSLPYQAEILVEPKFSANLLGSPLVLLGKSKPFAKTHESALDLDIEHFDLSSLQPYLPDSLPFRLKRATVDSELKLVFKELADQVFSLSLTGQLHLTDLALEEDNGQPLIGWKKLDIEMGENDLINQSFEVERITLDGLDTQLAVSKGGKLNWLRVAEKLVNKPAAGVEKEPAGKALTWQVHAIKLSHGVVHWRDDSNLKPVQGDVRDIELLVGKVDSTLVNPVELSEASWQIDLGDRFKVDRVLVKEVKVDLARHQLNIGELNNQKTQIRMLRNKEGNVDWISAPVLETAKEVRQEKRDNKPWGVSIGKLAVSDLLFRLEDQTTSPAAVQVVDGFNLTAEDLTTEAGKKSKLSVKTRINQKGSLTLGGSVQLSPLQASLQLETLAVPLMPLQPYFSDLLNISLTRGQVSSVGEIFAEQGKDGLNARYKGSVTLGDLLTVDKLNNADFLKWKSLYVGGVDFQLLPMSVSVGEIALSDFYSRLIVGADGQLNLANIVKKPAPAVVPEAEKKALVVASNTATPAVAPSVAEKSGMPIKIAKVTLQGGTVNFSDYFVKPNYTANLTKVGGRVSGLSSVAGSVADMELRGSYANSAPVSVVAKLNPFAAKSYLDLKAEVSGVDLVAMSPYSGKYAGYNIDKGKLSLNVAYKLENGHLNADNRLFIDQLTFGSKVESPTATSLPVNLAISLLKNNRGEIDLNLPISGSLDDPQFSIGGLVVKVIINLFVKAVTSPFALLGSMFGGGEELSNIEFAPGRAAFNDAATKKLENLAKALRDRESLKLEITGRADPEADKEGIKWVAIDRAVRAEKQKDLIKKGSDSASLDQIEISDSEYPVFLEKAYKEAKFPKPRNMVGLLKELPREEMEKLMLTYLPASPDDVRQLAIRRAEHVQGWLVEQGKVPQSRIFLLPPKLEVDEKAKATRVDFSLR